MHKRQVGGGISLALALGRGKEKKRMLKMKLDSNHCTRQSPSQRDSLPDTLIIGSSGLISSATMIKRQRTNTRQPHQSNKHAENERDRQRKRKREELDETQSDDDDDDLTV
jgi:hypothetical protein